MLKPWRKVNESLEQKSTIIAAWSSLLQIILIPTILLTVILGYYQLSVFLEKPPDLHLEFSTPTALTYTVVNSRDKTAEIPSYGFGIFDLSSEPIETVPIPWEESSFLGGVSGQGPNELMSRYGIAEHRYFGFAAVTCKNCERTRWYWIHFIHGSDQNAWVVELEGADPKIWNPTLLLSDPNEYIEANFPVDRRMPIK